MNLAERSAQWLQRRPLRRNRFLLCRSPHLSHGNGDVREHLRRLRGDRLLADSQTDWFVRRDGKHDIGRVVRQGATVPFGKAKHRRRAHHVGQNVWKQSVCDFLRIGVRVFGCTLRSYSARDRIDDGLRKSDRSTRGPPTGKDSSSPWHRCREVRNKIASLDPQLPVVWIALKIGKILLQFGLRRWRSCANLQPRRSLGLAVCACAEATTVNNSRISSVPQTIALVFMAPFSPCAGLLLTLSGS
jgi:hypothetical protein